MTTADELLEQMEANTETPEVDETYILVDPVNQILFVPESQKLFGVYQDANYRRKFFKCPKTGVNNFDLSTCYFFVNYFSSGSNYGQYLVDDVAVDGDYITFSWELTGNVFDGNKDTSIRFAVQAKKADVNGSTQSIFNTRPETGNVYSTIESTEKIEEEYADVILELLARMDNVERGVNFEIRLHYISGTYSIDKSYEEIMEAYNKGMVLILNYNNSICQLNNLTTTENDLLSKCSFVQFNNNGWTVNNKKYYNRQFLINAINKSISVNYVDLYDFSGNLPSHDDSVTDGSYLAVSGDKESWTKWPFPAISSGDTNKLLGVNNGEYTLIDVEYEIPVGTPADNGKVLGVVGDGTFDLVDIPQEVPVPTTDDEGKIIGVTNGAYELKEVDIPTNLSDLNTDNEHQTVTSAEKQTWNDKSDFSGNYEDLTNKPTIPSKTSELTNDSNFATESYVDQEIAQFDFIKIVDTLPETGLPNRLYLVPKSGGEGNDLFDEYVWSNGAWEFITTKQVEVDLTGYVKKTDYQTDKTDINTALADRYTKAETEVEIDNAIDAVEIGGRNYYKKSTYTFAYNADSNVHDVPHIDYSNSDTPNGFLLSGVPIGSGCVRMTNVIDGNGDWTVSFWLRGSQDIEVELNLNICDMGDVVVRAKSDNSWVKIEHTVKVTNYSPDIYNFVDFDNLQYVFYYIKDIKIERGNKATDWTPAPEDLLNTGNYPELPTTDKTVIGAITELAGRNTRTLSSVTSDFLKYALTTPMNSARDCLLSGGDYIGNDLPVGNYVYGCASIYRRYQTTKVILWGLGEKPVINTHDGTLWDGWKDFAGNAVT